MWHSTISVIQVLDVVIWNTRQKNEWEYSHISCMHYIHYSFFLCLSLYWNTVYTIQSWIDWQIWTHSMWNGHGLSLWIVTRRKDRETERGILAECHSVSTKCNPHLSFSTERILPGSFNERWIRWTRGSRKQCQRRKLLISQIHNEDTLSPFAITLGKAVDFSCMNWVAALTFSLF